MSYLNIDPLSEDAEFDEVDTDLLSKDEDGTIMLGETLISAGALEALARYDVISREEAISQHGATQLESVDDLYLFFDHETQQCISASQSPAQFNAISQQLYTAQVAFE